MNGDKDLKKERLISLIEFAQQSAKLRSKPVTTAAKHKFFSLHEHELHDLPSIQLDIATNDGRDKIWMSVGRLRETVPPEITDSTLRPWVKTSQDPTEEPRLLQNINGAHLIATGIYISSKETTPAYKESIDPDETVTLAQYDKNFFNDQKIFSPFDRETFEPLY